MTEDAKNHYLFTSLKEIQKVFIQICYLLTSILFMELMSARVRVTFQPWLNWCGLSCVSATCETLKLKVVPFLMHPLHSYWPHVNPHTHSNLVDVNGLKTVYKIWCKNSNFKNRQIVIEGIFSLRGNLAPNRHCTANSMPFLLSFYNIGHSRQWKKTCTMANCNNQCLLWVEAKQFRNWQRNIWIKICRN